MQKIILIGTHGQYNIGDEMLLETFLGNLGNKNKYYVNSYNPRATADEFRNKYDIRTFHTKKSIFKLAFYIMSADCLIFAGGSIIKELQKTTGRNKFSSLLMVLLLAFISKKIFRKKIIMSNIGVGPLNNKFGKKIARLIFDNVDFVSLRDTESKKLLLAICPQMHQDAMVVPDAIFSNSRDYFCKMPPRSFAKDGYGYKIGLNLNFDLNNPDNWGYFIRHLYESVIAISEQAEVSILGLPMQSRFNEYNDFFALNDFFKKFHDIDIKNKELISSADLGDAINGCDIILAERLHLIIACIIMNKPFIAFSYDIKIKSILSDLKLDRFVVDINNRDFDSSLILNKIMMIKNNYEEVVLELKSKSMELKQNSDKYFNALRELID